MSILMPNNENQCVRLCVMCVRYELNTQNIFKRFLPLSIFNIYVDKFRCFVCNNNVWFNGCFMFSINPDPNRITNKTIRLHCFFVSTEKWNSLLIFFVFSGISNKFNIIRNTHYQQWIFPSSLTDVKLFTVHCTPYVRWIILNILLSKYKFAKK